MDFEQAIQELRSMVVSMVEIQKGANDGLTKHNDRLQRLEAEAAEYRRRTDQNLAEITDKLNGLIGYVAGLKPPEPPRLT